MWEARRREVRSGYRYQVFAGSSQLSFRELFTLLETDPAFGRWYADALAATDLVAFFWEHPPLTRETFDAGAEFVTIEAAALANLRADPAAFESQFARQPEPDVIAFSNLGGDATLVVPRPVGAREAYPHLAAFVRHGPAEQVLALLRTCARTLRESIGPTATWLSTAGLGVPWLHLRLDTRPKYYSFRPYTGAA